MHTNRFKPLVHSTWEYWQKHLDCFPEIDWEETEESMTILMPDGRKYLFNRHTGMQQLWMASPISGGRHFSMMGKGEPNPNPHGQDHTTCLHRSLLADGHDYGVPLGESGMAYWTDTRNGEIIESVMNTEFASHWNVVLDLQPFQAETVEHSMALA
jgi:frataxin-like iron-binding protein CyaY